MGLKQIRTFLESITDREALKKRPHVPIDKFGKDHWSLLAYIGTVVIDRSGIMEGPKLRTNKRPGIEKHFTAEAKWRPEWGTRLKGYFKNTNDKTLCLSDHDDIDCCEDMEAEGLITLGTMVSCFVQLTEKGREFLHALYRYKEDGGSFANFEDSPLLISLIKKYEYSESH